MRPNGKHSKKVEKQSNESELGLDNNDNVLSVQDNDDGKRIDLVAPDGADGCVMFIESRKHTRANSEHNVQSM